MMKYRSLFAVAAITIAALSLCGCAVSPAVGVYTLEKFKPPNGHQNAKALGDIARANGRGAEDICVNQHQVNSAGASVGSNRPEVQSSFGKGRFRVSVEDDKSPSTRGLGHAKRSADNDRSSVNILVEAN
jgi:hypothetical protein